MFLGKLSTLISLVLPCRSTITIRIECFLWIILHYISNAKRMPIDVRDAFKDVVEKEGNISAEDAENYLRQLEKTGRYLVETWF